MRPEIVRERVATLLIDDGMPPGEALNRARWLGHAHEGIDFRGKIVLDIGAGEGLHAMYALAAGASRVIALEPGAAGARVGAPAVLVRRARRASSLGLLDVETCRFEDLPPDRKFDVVLCLNTINHLAEHHVARLQHDQEARALYVSILGAIAQHLTQGGTLVLSDVSPRNSLRALARALRMRHPFAPTINWSLHQPPELWTELGFIAGLNLVSVRWLVPRRILPLGRILATRTGAWLLTSHFTLTFQPAPTRVV